MKAIIPSVLRAWTILERRVKDILSPMFAGGSNFKTGRLIVAEIMRPALFALALVFSLLVIQPAAANTISGRLVDDSGHPIAGVAIDCFAFTNDIDGNDYQAITDSNGNYVINGVVNNVSVVIDGTTYDSYDVVPVGGAGTPNGLPSNYELPPDVYLTIENNNGVANFVATNISQSVLGSLQVTVSPAGAVTAGAQWQVDGGTWQSSGATVANLPAGDYTVSFSTVNGWATPSDQVITVAAGATATATGTYTQVPTGSLHVTLAPAGAVTAGAQWQVDSGAWQSNGATVAGLSVGDHTLSFSTVNGWTQPTDQIVTISANTSATATGTYTQVPPGSLQVNIAPAGAVTAGAQWQVDGGAWQSSGATVANLSVGNHTVSYNSVSGWSPPANQVITISSGVTATAAGTYTQAPPGSLQVTLAPAGAVTAGAQWQVDGGTWQSSGATATNLGVGNHTVSFSIVSGWYTPSNQVVTISSGVTATATGNYVVVPTGSLQVTLTPAGAVTAGAQWQVDGGTWQNTGATVASLSVGTHTVSFSTVSGWYTPTNQTVTIVANATATASGTYVVVPTGSVLVTITPAGAITAGAQWQLDAGSWQNSGATITNLLPGSHAISFSTVNGWFTPGNQVVTVIAGGTATASGSYTPTPESQFNFYTNNGAIIITDYIGGGSSVVIPGTIYGLPVTSIGDSFSTFYGNTNLTSITIPASVTNLANGVFGHLPSLTAIVVDTNNPAYSSMNGILFSKDQTSLIEYPPGLSGGYTVAGSVTSIGGGAFENCDGLTNVIVSANVAQIGSQAFLNCANLVSFYFQGNAPAGGSDATMFQGSGLTSVYYFQGTTGWGQTYGGLPAVDHASPYIFSITPANPTPLLGTNVSFTVVAQGDATLSYQWQLNGTNLTDNARLSGSQSSVLTLNNLAFSDAGLYLVVVSNASGSITNAVNLIVASPVVILSATLNTNIDRQTGLFYQQLVVTNPSPFTVTGVRFTPTNLPAIALTNPVILMSATGTNGYGAPYIDYAGSLAPNSMNKFTLAYYSKLRKAPAGVGVLVEVESVIVPTNSVGTAIPLSAPHIRTDGKMVFQFGTLSNRIYAVQYSTNLVTWKQAQTQISGNGSVLIWADAGPPDTDANTAKARFYRVLLLPQ